LPGNNGSWSFGFWREALGDKNNGWFESAVYVGDA